MVLNEEQALLKDTIADFLDEHAPTTLLREMRDTPNSPAWPAPVWSQLCEMGVPACALPEDLGGLGFGWLGLGTILEEAGKRLSPLPLLSSVAVATSVVRHCASQAQLETLLSDMATGTSVLTLAHQEQSTFHQQACDTIEHDGKVSGTKVMVMDATGADHLLVSAKRHNGSQGVALVPTNSAGLHIDEETLFDGRKYARISLFEVSVDTWLEGADVTTGLQRALDEAAIAVACDMMGGARELLERTVSYLCEREQFGVKIGSFQALQHRCAQAYCDLELAESTLLAALFALDKGDPRISEHASRAKAMAGDIYQHISNEAVQLHGGMGVTDEMDIGLFLKRSRVCNQLFGDSSYHRARFATLRGF